MADMHILTGNGDRWTVIMHLPVPNTNNPVGTNWRTAVVASRIGGSTSLPDGDGTGGTISAAEKALIEAGEVIEHSASVRLESMGTVLADQRAALRAWFAAAKVNVLVEVQKRLRYFGYNESEA